MRDRQVIVVKNYKIKNRTEIDGCPVWGWSKCDGSEHGEPSVVDNAIPGDYIVWHEPYTEEGRVRLVPWSVIRARPLNRKFSSRLAQVSIGCGARSRHRTVEAAVKAAVAALRMDERCRADAERRAKEESLS